MSKLMNQDNPWYAQLPPAPAFPHWLLDPEYYSCSPMVLGIDEATHCKLALLDATKRVVEVGGDLTIDYDKTRRRLASPWHTSWRSTRWTWWLLSAMPVTARGLHAPIISRPNSTEDNSHRIARTTISSVFLVSDYTHQNREKARRVNEMDVELHGERGRGYPSHHVGVKDRPMAIGRTTVVAFETHRGGKILLTLGEAFSIRNHSEEFKGDRGSHDGFLLQLKKKVIWL
uniref:Uncharacterized protein n=1 Tax=Oryza barthii TaxID=65489 RepID=A0A0D3HC27_9ORYZ